MAERKEIPLLGLGTWKLQGSECTRIVEEALSLGYSHIDTALSYGNHKDIAKALVGKDLSKLYVTSKFPIESVDFSCTEKSISDLCDQILEELNMEKLDLLLIHAPDHEVPMHDVIFAMEKLRERGKIAHLGVSNFTIHHLQNLLHHEAFVFCNQVEFHPYLFQKDLFDFCRAHHISLVAYRPLGKGELLIEPLFAFLGKKYLKSPAQIILRWIVQKGIPVIPKASSKEHLQQNSQIFDFRLEDTEMNAIDALHRGIRYCMPDFAEFSY